MLKGAANDWEHFASREQVQAVVTATDETTDPETQENRKAIVDYYVKRGDHEFRRFI